MTMNNQESHEYLYWLSIANMWRLKVHLYTTELCPFCAPAAARARIGHHSFKCSTSYIISVVSIRHPWSGCIPDIFFLFTERARTVTAIVRTFIKLGLYQSNSISVHCSNPAMDLNWSNVNSVFIPVQCSHPSKRSSSVTGSKVYFSNPHRSRTWHSSVTGIVWILNGSVFMAQCEPIVTAVYHFQRHEQD